MARKRKGGGGRNPKSQIPNPKQTPNLKFQSGAINAEGGQPCPPFMLAGWAINFEALDTVDKADQCSVLYE